MHSKEICFSAWISDDAGDGIPLFLDLAAGHLRHSVFPVPKHMW